LGEEKYARRMTWLTWKDSRESADAPQTSTFEELAIPLLTMLYNFAHSFVSNHHEAEDLVQEALLKALRGFSSFEPGTNFKAWIFRILRNTYLTSLSRLAASRTVALEEELADEDGPGRWPEGIIDHRTPELNLIRLADRAALERAMKKLSPTLLEMILLCDVEDLKYKEIAVVLEIPIGTVMSRVARARAALRRELESDDARTGEVGP
jgi:RNA polymerase sigma-70 factor, ECF subfamily